MKELIKLNLAAGDFGGLQATALVLFFGVMIGVALWVFRPGSREYYESVSSEMFKGESNEKKS